MNQASKLQLSQELSDLQAAYRQQPYPSLAIRRYHLSQMLRLLLDNQAAIIAAISDDFGYRSPHESRLIEIFPAIEGLRYSLKHLKKWLKPQHRQVSLWYFGASNRVQAQPLGVVGVIVPWNYPLYLAFAPLTDALAAGNKLMIKMSELSPALSHLLIQLLPKYLPDDVLRIYSDDGSLGPSFSALPFDHLIFTGSTQTGRKVMAAAAQNLTPVTLELGGKSPVIVAEDYPITQAAERILMGKLLNAGQTCVAPDYVLLPKGTRPAFIQACLAYTAKHYSDMSDPALSNMISADFLTRLVNLREQAIAQGAEFIPLIAGECAGKFTPGLLVDAAASSLVMQQEIFGPLLPIVEYQDLSQAITYVNQTAPPLALYLFTKQFGVQLRVQQQIQAGGLCINEVLLHVAQHQLPFGGVGSSGMGHYHGYDGFVQFSKMLPIFKQGPFAATRLMRPPYTRISDYLLKLMTRG
ncbi:coniferyl aldehyde dehydrogenase [Agarivorans sp. QJM3NY_33]|uniref:coniferyl aldehyde dehydrogenase n=1 Tax=Agarivorans sp. QJM3NY_33 TaxID=3421432 RepID=UPI003D7DF1B2